MPVDPGSGSSFGDRFLWGTATAAHQVEGGNDASDWWDWELEPGRIARGERSGAAVDHYGRFEADLDLALALHGNAYRFSVEWSRVEPSEGSFRDEAIEHYRRVALACRERGLTPMVTLFHFTLPRWLARQGGFENPSIVEKFARFAGLIGRTLSGTVDLWCTLNEPLVYALAAYGAGVFPPGKRSLACLVAVVRNLIEGHVAAYRQLHAAAAPVGNGPMVGIAKHLRVFDPASPRIADRVCAWALDRLFNRAFLDALSRGEAVMAPPGGRPVRVSGRSWAGTMDYVGVNYYSRDLVSFDPAAPFFSARSIPAGAATSDLGWEIYPAGMARVLSLAGSYRLPIYVTENGIADGADTRRRRFIADHLTALAQAQRSGLDVRGYFHWSLMDNFEWIEGFAPRFGLYTVDYATHERRITDGARFFAEVARANALPGAI